MEISRARDRAELVTDNKAVLRGRFEAVTGERIAALEAVWVEASERPRSRIGCKPHRGKNRSSEPPMDRSRTPKSIGRDLGL